MTCRSLYRLDPLLDTKAGAYTLEAVCLHRGDQAIQGHYRALLFSRSTSAISKDVQTIAALLFLLMTISVTCCLHPLVEQ